MDSFQRFAPQARFAPEQVADIASTLEQRGNEITSDMQRYAGQVNNAHKIGLLIHSNLTVRWKHCLNLVRLLPSL